MLFYSIFYFLLSFFLVYPPVEFVSAGFSIPQLFSVFLGSEDENFVEYHILRTTLTLFVHSCLPLGYFVGLYLNDSEWAKITFGSGLVYFWWQIMLTTSITVPLLISYKLLEWSKDQWANHPISQQLTQFSGLTVPWKVTAARLNDEFRRVNKVSITTNTISKIIVTDSWVIKVRSYMVDMCHQDTAILIAFESVAHNLSPLTGRELQFVNIEVKSADSCIKPFKIRLNSMYMQELQDKLQRPMIVLPNVVYHKTLLEEFLDVFKKQIRQNEKYIYDREVELCIGCMQAPSNVKLHIACPVPTGDLGPRPIRCTKCNCRPMWCADCLGRWFASRQDPDLTSEWLSKKCTCPVCRANFCILDVAYIETVT